MSNAIYDRLDMLQEERDQARAERDELRARINLARIKLQDIAERQVGGMSDNEQDHIEADGILLDVIDDDEIRKAFASLAIWYA